MMGSKAGFRARFSLVAEIWGLASVNRWGVVDLNVPFQSRCRDLGVGEFTQ